MQLRSTVKYASLIKRGVALAMTQATLARKLGYSEAGFIRAKKAGLPKDVVDALKSYIRDPLSFQALPPRKNGRPSKIRLASTSARARRKAPKGTQ